MLSQTVEYALRAAVYLADKYPSPRTAEQIAAATLVSHSYLSKVLLQLSRSRVVSSQRGIHGGFCLLKSPDKLTMLEIVNGVEPIQRIHECPLQLASHGNRLCPLHKRLDSAMAVVEKAFGTTTLAQILAEPSESVPLCADPRQRQTTK